MGTAPGSAADLLENPNLILTPIARRDLEDGVVDQRVIDFLAWATSRHRIAVSVLRTGHSPYVRGTDRISTHFVGRGADIVSVDGEPVSAGSAGARAFAQEVAGLGEGQPDETVGPWADALALPGFLANSDHQDHIHVGWHG